MPAPGEVRPEHPEPGWVTGAPTSAPVKSRPRKRQLYSSTTTAPMPVVLAAISMLPLASDITVREECTFSGPVVVPSKATVRVVQESSEVWGSIYVYVLHASMTPQPTGMTEPSISDAVEVLVASEMSRSGPATCQVVQLGAGPASGRQDIGSAASGLGCAVAASRKRVSSSERAPQEARPRNRRGRKKRRRTAGRIALGSTVLREKAPESTPFRRCSPGPVLPTQASRHLVLQACGVAVPPVDPRCAPALDRIRVSSSRNGLVDIDEDERVGLGLRRRRREQGNRLGGG